MGRHQMQAADSGVRSSPLLSPRRRQVLALTGKGLTSKEIAGSLAVSRDTVKNTRGTIHRILGAREGTHAVVLGLKTGEVSLDEMVDQKDNLSFIIVDDIFTDKDKKRVKQLIEDANKKDTRAAYSLYGVADSDTYMIARRLRESDELSV